MIFISAEFKKDDSVFKASDLGQKHTLQAVDMYNAHLEKGSQHVHSVPEKQNGTSDEEPVL